MTEAQADKSMVIKKIKFLKQKLDREIGYNYWKRYVASAFWSQISTPINLTITFLTAITTAQAQTGGLISQETFAHLTIVSLIITTLNTFFRPHTQYAANTDLLGKWVDLGVRYENEFYDRIEAKTLEEFKVKLAAFEVLNTDVNTLRKIEGTGSINFLTDILFMICISTCLAKYKCWLDRDVITKKEKEKEEAATTPPVSEP